MNTVFRDGSNVLFAGRKTYTALKSCYHRNLEVFKQIYAFESYLNSPAFTDETPVHGDPAVARQAVLERTLEAARAAGSLVGPLTVKVLDHWYAMGWYTLFKKRFRADASGVPVPLFGQTGAFPLPGMASPAAQAQTNIDPRLVTVSNGDEDEDAEHEQDQDQLSTTNGHPSPDPGAGSNSVSYARSLLRNPESSPIRSGQLHPHDQSPSMPYAHSPGSAIPSRTSPMNYGSAYPYAAQAPLADPRPPPDWQAQTAQALTQLTAVAQSLLGVCTALADMLRSQADENRARVEMMRRGAEGGGGGASGGHGCRDTAGEGSRDKDTTMMMQKVSYATEVLKNPDMNEEVRRMATDFLKRFFMQE
ncbi:hypothetical protein A0H81_07828 [Grifola frondosa]|uniref:Uncharacterized protein n=1 Tax=Grifola frondosa TaxID=5627 RepID=A0A1C7M588_GRIFR|nr:hypothetical protein A0H81_07828 [Grifola frondosa]